MLLALTSFHAHFQSHSPPQSVVLLLVQLHSALIYMHLKAKVKKGRAREEGGGGLITRTEKFFLCYVLARDL